ncbi:MAG: nucleotidyltransferase domain-containing protein [Chloroflexi bacterium]|nr:nucleotidyltransferase domain-containing protein [Chloroflexota bacterium]MYD47802.1 nucleotidyltransferase domain-containing protein [Chloroflexota bacterium]
MTRIPDIPPATWEKMKRVFATYPELTSVTLHGSRATGKATPRSDFDLATHGITDHYRLGRLALDLEDLDIPQTCEVQAYESIQYAPFKRHIDDFGIAIYHRQNDAI